MNALFVVATVALRAPLLTPTRRAVLISSATSLLSSRAAFAAYGEGAAVAVPAFLPSPIRPQGAMADTCEVVALGREDVCLEPKKLLTSYESMQLDKWTGELDEIRGIKDPELIRLVEVTLQMIAAVKKNQFGEVEAALAGLDAAAALERVATDDEQQKLAKAVKQSLAALGASAAKKDASPSARLLIKLSGDLCKLF